MEYYTVGHQKRVVTGDFEGSHNVFRSRFVFRVGTHCSRCWRFVSQTFTEFETLCLLVVFRIKESYLGQLCRTITTTVKGFHPVRETVQDSCVDVPTDGPSGSTTTVRLPSTTTFYFCKTNEMFVLTS